MKRIVLYDASAIDRPTREDLHRLARMRLDARRGGCDLVLTGVGQRLRLLLAVTGLDEVFTISPDPPDLPDSPGFQEPSHFPEPPHMTNGPGAYAGPVESDDRTEADG